MRRLGTGMVWTLSAVLAWQVLPAVGQQTLDYPIGTESEYVLDSGGLDNPGDDLTRVFTANVQMADTVSLRVFFSEVALGEGSFISVTSMDDFAVQDMDTTALVEWSNSTAYFNGDEVQIELFAGPRTFGNRLVTSRVWWLTGEGDIHTAGTCGICGPDNRVPSGMDFACRLLPVGCSATVWNTESCLVSAGHCAQSRLVAQFRVPDSTTGCQTRNPGPEDQFPVQTIRSRNGGVGADWSVMTTGTNNQGQKAYERYGMLRSISQALGNTGDPIDTWGYGIDDQCTRSQTQQLSSGSITRRNSTYYDIQEDITFGNSGSNVILDGEIIGIVTHCRTNCPNICTRVDNSDFAAAREALCPGGGGGPECSDIKKLKAKCKPNGTIKGKVVLWTTDFSGETITATIDSTEVVATIDGRKAKFNMCCYNSGSTHTVSLVDPPGCPFSKDVTCP